MKTTRYATTHKCHDCKVHTSVLATEDDVKALNLHISWPATRNGTAYKSASYTALALLVTAIPGMLEFARVAA